MARDPLFDCVRALQEMILYIDNEIADLNEKLALEHHLDECQPCHSELEHERFVIQSLKRNLTNECCEEAPSDLNEKIAAQTAALAAQIAALSGPQIITEIHTTETTIIGDTVIEIETHEIRRDFPPLN
jgi:hypothetical protein